MTSDPFSKKITLNYTGGSITAPIGFFQWMLGDNYEQLATEPVDKEVSVTGHQRTRVIGGPSTAVSGHTYTYKQWPTSEAGFASGGTVCFFYWQDEPSGYTARVNGSMYALAEWLKANQFRSTTFRTQRGTKYGPF